MHPPHLTGPGHEMMPSALIPFCSYQSETLGKKIPDFDISACDSFQPVERNGRLCYTLKHGFASKSKQGKKQGLLLMIDPGQIEDEDEESFSFELYVHILSGFSGFKAGSYALSSLKQMTGTSGFMSLPEDQKRCQVEVREDCQRAKLFDEFQKQCECVPWAISGNYKGKVTF